MPSVGSSSSSTFGSGGQRAGDRQLLLLAAGEVAAATRPHFLQHRKQRVDVLEAGTRRTVVDEQPGFDVFLHRHGGEDHAALRHEGDAFGDALVRFRR